MTPSQCLTRTFEKSQVFCYVENRYKNVSPSRLRFSVITELICLSNEDIDSVAHCFVNLSVETCKKFHVQFFSNRKQHLYLGNVLIFFLTHLIITKRQPIYGRNCSKRPECQIVQKLEPVTISF